MKSAYELAMERLEKERGPSRSLTDEQRAAVADIDKRFEAKEAETRMDYETRMASDPANAAALQHELAEVLADLRGKREREKEAIWDSAG